MVNIPPGLREAIKADELVLFVGAGLSWDFKNKKNETLEGWTKMASSITSYLCNNGHIPENLKQACDTLGEIKTLEILEEREIGIGEVGPFIRDYFTLGDSNDFSLQKKLFELSTKIITTNYDRAFEVAVPQLQSQKAYKGKDYELNGLKKDPVFLFKLHGCIEHLDSMVLFPSDYGKLYNSNRREAEHTLSALRNLIFNKTFLFIGTGLGDPQINSFFEEIKIIQGPYNQKHYIITPDPLEKSLDFLTRIPITSYEEIPGIIDQLLEIKRAQDEKNTPLNEQLKETEKRNEVLTKELEEVKDKNERNLLLLEWESNNRFNRGLRYHLAGEYLDASEEYKVATILNPKNYEAFCNWGATLSDLAETKSGIEAEKLYDEAIEKYQKAIECKPDYQEAYNNWGNALSDLAKTKSGIEAEKLYDEAIEKYQKAIEYKLDYYEAYNNWGATLSDLAKTKSGIEAEKLYDEAIEKYQKAIEYKLDYYEAYNNWGATLSDLAKTKSGIEAEKLYDEAIEKYQKAIECKPDYQEAYNNWGATLSDLAKTKSGIEAEKLYDEAIEKYQKAIECKPDYQEAYNNWGATLSDLAKTKSGIEAEKLYDEAIEKYQKAIECKPDYQEAYNNWGVALMKLAETKSGIEAEKLYDEAIEKYQKAVEYKPDFYAAYNNWGATLSDLAKTKSGSEAEELYDKAFEKFQQAIKYGGGSYNLACLYALRNRKEEALKYLDHALSRGKVSVKLVEEDNDWDAFREDPDFKHLLSQYKGK
ncbi:tetratricopeptide repeat protein [Porphyromonas endodontalis]|nr:tetratricopeptide repeat protein [Porphyromonas endodontalis]UBH64356.1 tetratricopeptide repeat protein [Porphyromonas endodontalis]SUB67353.1 photosystem I assembly protein Ycf3 [Porphyromonas endodontalis]